MKNQISHKDGDATSCGKSQTEYIAKLESKLIEQANEILMLKRKLNGVGGNDA